MSTSHPSFAPPRNTLPFESEPPGQEVAGEDFLFYLSRGCELLKDNQIEPAKEALELAIGLQPRDLRGQGLLGVVYFRLGMYPRAIELFQQIVVAYPDEISPKVNLSLCFVKTGQAAAARELLEDVVRRKPTHLRAWAYLGLVFQFQQDFEKAQIAYERAGQRVMADRMSSLAQQAEPAVEEVAPERWELRAAAEDAFTELENDTSPFRVAESLEPDETDSRSGKWRATEPGEQHIPEVARAPRRPSTPPPSVRPPPLSSLGGADFYGADLRTPVTLPETSRLPLREWFEARLPSQLGGPATKVDPRTVLVELDEPFAVRADSLVLLSPATVAKSELRLLVRGRGRDEQTPLGGAQSPLLGFSGPGQLMARASQVVELFELEDETVTVRETLLFGMSLGLRYDCERYRLVQGQGVDMVRLTGRGLLALALPVEARAIEVPHGGLVVRGNELVGWTAQVLPESLEPAESPGRARGFWILSGTGTALLA